jgi:hypothetical protein
MKLPDDDNEINEAEKCKREPLQNGIKSRTNPV